MNKWLFSLPLMTFLLVPVFTNTPAIPIKTGVKASESFDQQSQDGPVVEVREASDNFHRSVIQAAVKAQREGKLKRAEVVRLRVAMISPAFRQQVEDLAVVQMSASGSEATPIGENGQVDRASIDWAGLAAFLEKLLPLILQLIDAFSTTVWSLHYV